MGNAAFEAGIIDPPLKDYSIESMLWKACSHSRIIHHHLAAYSESAISEYLKHVFVYAPVSLQARNDLSDTLYRIAEPIVGPETASDAASAIMKYPIAMTANHHGVDFFAQSVQSSLLFALGSKLYCNEAKSAMVFACGNIPLDNITYPQGFMVYGVPSDSLENAPLRIPLFPNSLRRRVVSTAPGYDDGMIDRALRKIGELESAGAFLEDMGKSLRKILNEGYGSQKVFSRCGYSGQATRINDWLWRSMLQDSNVLPKLIFLELEEITAHLVLKDLDDSSSLLWSVLFNPSLRENTFIELDGHPACWKTKAHADDKTSSADTEPKFKGTHFFWAISDSGRKCALQMMRDGSGELILSGIDNRGKKLSFPFFPGALKNLIQCRKIIPSLFTCFLEISFARSINCVGGYYQAAYLPEMLAGVIRAVHNTPGYASWEKVLQHLPTSAYLSGMQTVMAEIEGRYLVPAGPVEIIGKKGLDEKEIKAIGAMTLKDAHAASLFETIPDIAPWEIQDADWRRAISADCHRKLKDRVVIR